MPKAKTTYPEINDIREDLNSLKSNVVELTKHVRHDGAAQTTELKKMLMGRLKGFQSSGQKQIQNVEKRIADKPAKSVAIAFAAGLAASMFLSRR